MKTSVQTQLCHKLCKHGARTALSAVACAAAGAFFLLAPTISSSGQSSLYVHTQPANAIRANSAALNGMILPGSNPASAWFEWGTSTQYGNIAALTNVAASDQVIALRHTLNGLSQDYVYHFRLVASNDAGFVYGADQQFALGGSVVVWGNPNFGHTIVPADLTNAVAISAGGDHCLALRNDGTVAAWGGNAYGQTNVALDLNNVLAIAAGQYHSLALQSDGTVRAWGAGTTFVPNPDPYNMEGGQSIVPVALSDVVQIAAGTTHSLALKADGTVAAWGSARLFQNAWSELGQAQVPPGLSNVVAISGGDFHSIALKADGTVVVWGDNTYGQGDITPGLDRVVAIKAGWYHNLALKSDCTLSIWGFDGSGAVTGLPPGLDNVAGMAGGGFYSLAFGADGAVWGWGGNLAGESDIPPSVQNSVIAMAAGYDFSMALQTSAPIEVALKLEPFGDQLQITWLGGVLQSATDADGPYTDVDGAASPLILAPSEAQRFYRIRVQR